MPRISAASDAEKLTASRRSAHRADARTGAAARRRTPSARCSGRLRLQPDRPRLGRSSAGAGARRRCLPGRAARAGPSRPPGPTAAAANIRGGEAGVRLYPVEPCGSELRVSSCCSRPRTPSGTCPVPVLCVVSRAEHPVAVRQQLRPERFDQAMKPSAFVATPAPLLCSWLCYLVPGLPVPPARQQPARAAHRSARLGAARPRQRARKNTVPSRESSTRCTSRRCPGKSPVKLISSQVALLPGAACHPTAGARTSEPATPEPAPLPAVAAGYGEEFTSPAPAPGCCGTRRPATGRPASRKPRWRSPCPCPVPRSRRRTECRIR